MFSKSIASKLALLIAIGFVSCTVLLHFYKRSLLDALCQEDGVVEWATAIFYLFASTIFIFACKKQSFKNLWYWGFCILFFLVAGEELNWGQRLFRFSTPELLKDMNVQQEINLHNIKGIHGNIRMVGLLIVFGICYIIPITNKYVIWLKKIYREIKIPIYPLGLIAIPTLAILLMAVPRVLLNETIFNLDEIGELYLSIGFLLFSLSEFGKRGQTPFWGKRGQTPF